MFSSIRTCIVLALLLLFGTLSRNNKGKLALFSLGITVLWIILSFIPVENLFYRFDTLEDAFHYSMGDKTEIMATYQTDDQGVAFYGDGYAVECKILDRDEKGWKTIPRKEFSRKDRYPLPFDLFLRMKPANNGQCLILIRDIVNKEESFTIQTLSDSQNSEFSALNAEGIFGTERYIFAFIDWPDPSYTIYVNGKSVKLSIISPLH